MRVKLCARCPYTPRDLASHYDSEAALHACAKCDGQQEGSTNHYPRKAHRRQRCATFLSTPRTPQPSVARSVTASSVSSGTTSGERHSVQASALAASSAGRRVTADGYAGFKQPDNGYGKTHAAVLAGSGFRSKAVAP
jgi:hypothetical protein